MQLVIAEKPSVAQSIAAVLGAKSREDGYLQGGGYIVSWCVGHLVELAQAEAYDERYKTWRYEDLPILPKEWQYVVSPGTKKQFSILRELMRQDDVGTLICATDAGREGELIFRLVYEQCGCKKPVKRLWISSMEETAIAEGFHALRDGKEYDNLYRAALCRAQADWLVGINATRLFSVIYRDTLNIGRVMTPTLSMLVMREAAIDAFQPEPFYTVQLSGGGLTVAGERLKDKAQAERICAACSGQSMTIASVTSKDKSDKPPKLYDLTALQRDANRTFGFTAQQTLDYAQSLYEKKLLTYPRTDSRYLTADMENSLPEIIHGAAAALALDAGLHIHPKQVVNNKKVSDHHALIPTATVASTDVAVLPKGERHILTLVALRLICAVANAYTYRETMITAECSGQTFTAKGKTVTDMGWRAAEAAFGNKADAEPEPLLPSVKQGAVIAPVSASIKEGKTSPPKHHTEDTLLSAMEHAGMEGVSEEIERRGLGTPATRAGILEKLVKTGFVERKRTGKNAKVDYLFPTRKAVALITVMPEALQSPILTAEWEEKLKAVERGELAPEIFMAEISDMTTNLIKTYRAVSDAEVLFPDKRGAIGKCPRCGSDVVESKKGFFCTAKNCGFALWKNNAFFAAKNKTLTKEVAVQLLKTGRANLKGLYSKKTGKTYNATVVMEDGGGKQINFMLEFAPRKQAAK